MFLLSFFGTRAVLLTDQAEIDYYEQLAATKMEAELSLSYKALNFTEVTDPFEFKQTFDLDTIHPGETSLFGGIVAIVNDFDEIQTYDSLSSLSVSVRQEEESLIAPKLV